MSCCSDPSCYDVQFSAERAADDLRRYRRKGPDRTTRLLLDALKRENVQDASVLDVGGGVGVIHHELLSAGATTATHVDAARPYIDAARQETERRGHGGRVQFVTGDFVEVSGLVPTADIVTLDRVICCYPDAEALVATSAAKARRLYGAVYPRNTWLQRLAFRFDNYLRKRRKSAFRTFVHPPPVIEAALRIAGLRPKSERETVLWRIAVYERYPDAERHA